MPHFSNRRCIPTFILVLVVVSVATDDRVHGSVAPIAVGFALAAAVLVAGPVTGGAVNPVRAIEPMLVAGQFTAMWVYIVGPSLGEGQHTRISRSTPFSGTHNAWMPGKPASHGHDGTAVIHTGTEPAGPIGLERIDPVAAVAFPEKQSSGAPRSAPLSSRRCVAARPWPTRLLGRVRGEGGGVGEVLWPARGPLVDDQMGKVDERNQHPVDVDLHPGDPARVERDSVDAGEQIDPLRCMAQLDHDAARCRDRATARRRGPW